jgi:hypothetical protein
MDEGNYPVVITLSRGVACLKAIKKAMQWSLLLGSAFWLSNWVRSANQTGLSARWRRENARRA